MAKYTKILIEGPDCSGKSTLVERLKNTLRWDAKSLHHRSGDQFHRYLREYATQDRIIFDRGHISEHVYGAMWRGGSPFTASDLHLLDTVCARDMLVIFAVPDKEILQQRYLARDYPQQIKLEELERARGLFEAYQLMSFDGDLYGMESPRLHTWKYSSRNNEELENTIAEVVRGAKK